MRAGRAVQCKRTTGQIDHTVALIVVGAIVELKAASGIDVYVTAAVDVVAVEIQPALCARE